jgi:TonB family protein
MQSSVVSVALATAFVLAPVAAGYASAWCQEGDFSITNQEPIARTPFRRDLMRQLQAWWDVHAYYPKHASNNDEAGNVKIHLQITPNGKIFSVALMESSGSKTLDAAGLSAFRTGAVHPFPEGEPETDLDLLVHYVVAHRHGDTLPATYTPTPSRAPFTIANDPVSSPVFDTMMQRTCTGFITINGGMNQPWRGYRGDATLIFFRKPDGTPWVKMTESGTLSISPAVQIGRMVQWVGPLVGIMGGGITSSARRHYTYTAWADGPNHLVGAEGSPIPNAGTAYATSLGGPIDMMCDTAVMPTVPYSDAFAQNLVPPTGDPP